VQALHALKNRNGLRLFDLSRPCDLRWLEHDCKMLCLVSPIFLDRFYFSERIDNFFLARQVCGKPVLNQASPDWTLAASYVASVSDPTAYDDSEADRNKRAQVMCAVAARNSCRLTSRWNTLVHNGCRIHFFSLATTARESDRPRQVRGAVA